MDNTTLSYINLFAILGSLTKLCEICPEAKELIADEKVSVGFTVKGGPSATLFFENGNCRIEQGVSRCNIKIPFRSPEKFNGMIDGVVTPIPSKGFLKIGFLLKKFTKLTDILTSYLRADEESLKNEDFFAISTSVMFYVITEAISQIANHDKIGSFSASNIVDGKTKIEIGGGESSLIVAKENKLYTLHGESDGFTSYLIFGDIKIARNLFDGKINAVAAVGLGDIRVGGMISAVDNINRILDRVSYYLA